MCGADEESVYRTEAHLNSKIRSLAVGCRAVIQLPWTDLDAFETDDKVFKVQRSPYNKVFPRCALIVHHGGAGTTQESLLSGRPSLIVAHVSDQFFWGSQLERLGAAGRTLKRKGLRPAVLARGIADVLAHPNLVVSAHCIIQIHPHLTAVDNTGGGDIKVGSTANPTRTSGRLSLRAGSAAAVFRGRELYSSIL